MAFIQKTWKDRVSEFINRRTFTKEDGTTELVTVERSEGTISQEGDAFSAKNMNDLEQRIADEFDEINNTIESCFQSVSDGKSKIASAITGKGVTTASDATFETMAENVKKISTEGIGKSQSMQYGIGGYGYTSLTYDFGKPVLGVVTFEITETGEGRTEITAMNVSGNEVAVTVHTNHGHGASGTLTITVKVKEG